MAILDAVPNILRCSSKLVGSEVMGSLMVVFFFFFDDRRGKQGPGGKLSTGVIETNRILNNGG